jgi:hypothetical protein
MYTHSPSWARDDLVDWELSIAAIRYYIPNCPIPLLHCDGGSRSREDARRRARLPRSVRASRVIGRQKFIHFECHPDVCCTAHRESAVASRSLSLFAFHTFNMSLAGSLPLKAAAPARIVSASRQCQRRSIAHSSRAQPKRPSIAAPKQQHNAPSIRVCLLSNTPPHSPRHNTDSM